MKLLKSFSIYTIASFVNKGMMFAIIPFLTNAIAPEQNGILSLYGIFVLFLIPFALLGFPNSIVMEYARLDKNEFKSFFSSSLFLSTISFTILLIVFFCFGNVAQFIVGAPYKLLLWGMLFIYFNLFFEGILSYLRTIEKPITFAIVSFCKNILELVLIIFLVIRSNMQAEGKVLAGVLSGFAITIFALIFFYRNQLLTTNIKKKYIIAELKFGISQIFFQLSLFVLASADKFMIHHLLNDSAGLGIYFVANQFAFIINVLVTAFFFSYQPVLYNYLTHLTPEHKYKLVKIKYLFIGFLFICTILLCIATPVFYNLFIKNMAYHNGIHYVAWNAFAYFFWGLYALFLGYLYFYRKNKAVIIFSVFSIIVCLLSNYFLIKEYKIMGAAYANLLTYFILFIAIFVTVNRLFKLQLPWFDFKMIFNKNNPANIK